jgi:hypothetical protein
MVRFAGPRLAAAFVLFSCLSLAAPGASAQELQGAPVVQALSFREAVATTPLAVPPAEQLPPYAAPSGPERPNALIPLYVSFGVLQLLDSHSTARALQLGAVEANPVMKGVAGNQAAMLAVKGAGTAGVIYATEKMWKKNRAAAIIFMAATNTAMAWVVQRNYQVR